MASQKAQKVKSPYLSRKITVKMKFPPALEKSARSREYLGIVCDIVEVWSKVLILTNEKVSDNKA